MGRVGLRDRQETRQSSGGLPSAQLPWSSVCPSHGAGREERQKGPPGSLRQGGRSGKMGGRGSSGAVGTKGRRQTGTAQANAGVEISTLALSCPAGPHHERPADFGELPVGTGLAEGTHPVLLFACTDLLPTGKEGAPAACQVLAFPTTPCWTIHWQFCTKCCGRAPATSQHPHIPGCRHPPPSSPPPQVRREHGPAEGCEWGGQGTYKGTSLIIRKLPTMNTTIPTTAAGKSHPV